MTSNNPSHLLALLYADIFNFPLTKKEMELYSIKQKTTSGVDKVKPEITNGYYHLPSRENTVSLRHKRELVSQKKLLKAQIVSDKLSRIPTILGIFVTGNLAMSNADENDDIDFLIISKANTLWFTRLLVTLYLEILGIRRRPENLLRGSQKRKRLGASDGDSFQNCICANMYLDELALVMPPAKQNLYTAHEVVQVKPLINKNNIYARFLSANSWVSHFLPNALSHPGKGMSRVNSLIRDPGSLLSWINSITFHFQYWYMRQKITRETITPHSAFFHPRDTGGVVLKKYQEKSEIILKS